MYQDGKGVASSWRRTRELYERAIELGSLVAVDKLQILTKDITVVTRSGKPPPRYTYSVRTNSPKFLPSTFGP